MRITDQIPDLREKNILDQIKSIPNLAEQAQKFDVAKAAQETLIDVSEEVDTPPFCLSLLQGSEPIGILTLDDFSVIAGQPKSRKTLLVSMILAAVLSGKDICGMIRSTLPEGKRGVIHIDSEQSKYHAHKAAKRALKLAGKERDPLFRPHRLRECSTDERKELLEYLIATAPELGFVIIDGIADFAKSINDEAEANEVADWLGKLSQKYNCHIMVVIHENKGSGHLRGHLGSRLQQKAQAVISVKREDDDVSTVSARDMRDFSFAPFAIGYDEENQPCIFDDYEIKEKSETSHKYKGKKANSYKKPLSEFTPSEHIEYLGKAFEEFGEKLKISELRTAIRWAYPDNFRVSDTNKCGEYLVKEGWIEKTNPEVKDSNQRFYWLSDKAKAERSPF